jgi:hypothetical protein
MADPAAQIVPEDPTIRREIPFKRFEYVDVTFGAADTDTVIPYTILRPNDVERVRWLDVTPNTVVTGTTTETRVDVYRSNLPGRLAWGPGYVVLRATAANYTTRLLLFLERT